MSGAPARGAEGTFDPGTGPAGTVMSADATATTAMGTPTAAVAAALTAADGATHNTAGPVYRRGIRAGDDSASHFSVSAPPAADDATSMTTSAATTLAASSSPDVAVSTTGDATAMAASAVDTGMDVHTDPSPAVIAPPTAEHVSSFLLHIRRRTADDVASSSPDATEGTIDGATATATARKRKRNRRGSGLHTAKDRRKMGAHNAACGMPAVVADDRPRCAVMSRFERCQA